MDPSILIKILAEIFGKSNGPNLIWLTILIIITISAYVCIETKDIYIAVCFSTLCVVLLIIGWLIINYNKNN